MNSNELASLAQSALEDLKGVDIVRLEIGSKSSFADAMLVATGTSRRHVMSLAGEVRLQAKQADMPPIGVEGEDSGDWVLVDLGDVIVHVMTAETREFYALEKLWAVGPDSQSADDAAATDAGSDTDATPNFRSIAE